MICLTIADQDTVHQLHARAQWFLWDQRHRRGNAGWFNQPKSWSADALWLHQPTRRSGFSRRSRREAAT